MLFQLIGGRDILKAKPSEPFDLDSQNMTGCDKRLASKRKVGSFHEDVVSIKRANGENANAGLGQRGSHGTENTNLVQCEWSMKL